MNKPRARLTSAASRPTLIAIRLVSTDGRRCSEAESIEQAIETAPVVAGFARGRPDVKGIALLNGFMPALTETGRDARGRRDRLYQQTRFLSRLARAYPNVAHWHQVSRRVVKDYLRSFGGRSPIADG